MNCSEIRHLLDDYLDDELSGVQQDAVERHVSDCPDCRRELDNLRSVVDRARDLSPELRPPHDLWPAIEARVRPAEDTGRGWWLRLAAAAIALFVLSIPLSVWWNARQEGEPVIEVEADRGGLSLTQQAVIARSEDGVLLPKTDLVTAIERHRDVVDVGTLTVFEENMALLDQAIGELRAALDEDPQNLRLRMLLAARYQQERKLLQKVNRV